MIQKINLSTNHFLEMFIVFTFISMIILTSSSQAASLLPTSNHAEMVFSTETTLSLENYQLNDFSAFITYLDGQPNLKQVDMYESVLTPDQMSVLSLRFPNITFGWTLQIGDHKLRTDATAFSTLHNRNSKPHTSADFEVLKYCKNLLALDIGHNAISDIDFIASLPQIRILILGRNRISNIDSLIVLKDLEYLELFSVGIKDITVLQFCSNLIDLNITNNNIVDLSPILGLPHLQRLWLFRSTGILRYDKFLSDFKQAILSALPEGCEVNFSSAGTGGGWREHPRYNMIYEIFHTGVYHPWNQ